ncbi:unnamed protein product [Protopolystoma xenopodis]|uniref:Uncharacterized protein n=1 Tax=Protopolystoma xenopodis TaxID=117903 RepID=A0A448XPE2_9PLAT|nr:unnamed protein product [Protopolystoma xenopodis]
MLSDSFNTTIMHGSEGQDNKAFFDSTGKPDPLFLASPLQTAAGDLNSVGTPTVVIKKKVKKAQRIRRRRRKNAGAAGEPLGLIVDGQSLRYALHVSLLLIHLSVLYLYLIVMATSLS